MEGHPLLRNGPVNTSRGNEYATIGCPGLGNVAVNTHATVEEGCFLCGTCRMFIVDTESRLQQLSTGVQSTE
jgi:hypothetical protein